MSILTDTSSVVRALGGTNAVAHLTGRSKQAVSNWHRQAMIFPSSTFVLMQTALARQGDKAPASLWGMERPAPRPRRVRRRTAELAL